MMLQNSVLTATANSATAASSVSTAGTPIEDQTSSEQDDDGRSLSSSSSSSSSSASSSLADEIEPRLKYERLGNHVQTIFQQQDTVSCVTFNSKIICLGTRWGMVHVFDHMGNSTRIEHLRSHTVAVNQISMDLVGEYIATCSDDGKAYAYGLYTTDHQLQYNFGRSVRAVAIDPLYYKLGYHRRFVTGDDRLLLHEKGYFVAGGLKTSILLEAVGLVGNIKWYGRFVACACRDNVRIYDVEERKAVGFIQWDRTENVDLAAYPCSLTWKNSTTLLIGWANTFRVCKMERRHSVIKESPSFMVNVVSTLRVGYFICGICPFDVSQLVILAFMNERDAEGQAVRPRMYLFQADDAKHVEVYSDTLSLRSFQQYTCKDYQLECLLEENRFIIACPKDVIVASIYDDDDRIDWLLEHSRYEEAMRLVTERKRYVQRNTVLGVGKRYVDHLLAEKEFAKAGQLCAQVFGDDKKQWENEVFKFAVAGQLRAISGHLPVEPHRKLDQHIYEMVLYEYLKREPKEFLKIVQKWSPKLYNVHAVINAVLEHIVKNPNLRDTLLEPLAVLYSHSEQYEKALNVYLALKHKGVFELIRKHQLTRNVAGEINNLMDLDAQQTIELLTSKDRLSSETVVASLKSNSYYLYMYLDALDTDFKTEGRLYHTQLVKLYASYCPTKLISLLRRSDNYPIHEALAICKEFNLHAETVYLLGRMGNTKEALRLLVNEIGDIDRAIIFCKEHNDIDLWIELVERSLGRPHFVSYLLQKIGTYIDPRILIRRIDSKMQIPELKDSLVKMLRDRSQQISIKEGCKNIVVSDCYNLHKSFVGMQQRGQSVDDELVCSVCHLKVLSRDNNNHILLFYCQHSFHEECLPSIGAIEKCVICSNPQGRDMIT